MVNKFFSKFKKAVINFVKVKLFRQKKKMVSNKTLESLVADNDKLDSRIFDLVMGRVLKRVYLSIDEKDRWVMENTFVSEDEESKMKFIEKYMPNFKEVFKEEAKKIEEEIKLEIEKQV